MISFIMPYIEDREEQLYHTLLSLEQQTDRDYEVILVCHTDTNPATAFNFGVDQARGDIICLTSPEVLNAHTNVAVMKLLPANTYWIGWCIEARLRDLPLLWSANDLRHTPSITAKVKASCTETDWQPWKYFLGVLHKSDYCGMDDYYTDGIAWEDRDFADTLLSTGVMPAFQPSIVGIHLNHSRKYQDDNYELRKRNRDYYDRKKKQLHVS